MENYERDAVLAKKQLCIDLRAKVSHNSNFKLDCELIDREKIADTIVGENQKLIHFVRHGQGIHNVAAKEWKENPANEQNSQPYTFKNDKEMVYLDPKLTEQGIAEAEKLVDTVSKLKLDILITSPLRRAMQTAWYAFGHVAELQFVANELAHEVGGLHTCDKRKSKTELAAEFPRVNFALIETEDDPLWGDGTERESLYSIGARGAKLMNFLASLEQTHIAVTSHSTILLALFNSVLKFETNEENATAWFGTGEMRSVLVTFTPKLSD